MITEIDYEIQQELVFLENADFMKDQMEVLGWTCVGEKVIDCATGRIQLEFRATEEGADSSLGPRVPHLRSRCVGSYFVGGAGTFAVGFAADAIVTGDGDPNSRKRSMFHAGAFGASSVCVIRINFALVGLSAIFVVSESPLPSATAVQAVPSSEISTL